MSVCLAVEHDSSGGYTLDSTDEKGDIYMFDVTDVAGGETVMMGKSPPVDVVLNKLGTEDMIERGARLQPVSIDCPPSCDRCQKCYRCNPRRNVHMGARCGRQRQQ